MPKARFTKAELRYLTEVDGHDHVALVAESERWPGTIVAVARYVRLDDDPDTAEAAIVVADMLQGLGLGTLLAERLAAAATVHGSGASPPRCSATTVRRSGSWTGCKIACKPHLWAASCQTRSDAPPRAGSRGADRLGPACSPRLPQLEPRPFPRRSRCPPSTATRCGSG